MANESKSIVPQSGLSAAVSLDTRAFDKLMATGAKVAVLGELTKLGIEQVAETHLYAGFLRATTVQRLNDLYQTGRYTEEQALALIQSDLRFLAHIDQLEELNALLTGQIILQATRRKR